MLTTNVSISILIVKYTKDIVVFSSMKNVQESIKIVENEKKMANNIVSKSLILHAPKTEFIEFGSTKSNDLPVKIDGGKSMEKNRRNLSGCYN